jgi:hypothetical protein
MLGMMLFSSAPKNTLAYKDILREAALLLAFREHHGEQFYVVVQDLHLALQIAMRSVHDIGTFTARSMRAAIGPACWSGLRLVSVASKAPKLDSREFRRSDGSCAIAVVRGARETKECRRPKENERH